MAPVRALGEISWKLATETTLALLRVALHLRLFLFDTSHVSPAVPCRVLHHLPLVFFDHVFGFSSNTELAAALTHLRLRDLIDGFEEHWIAPQIRMPSKAVGLTNLNLPLGALLLWDSWHRELESLPNHWQLLGLLSTETFLFRQVIVVVARSLTFFISVTIKAKGRPVFA